MHQLTLGRRLSLKGPSARSLPQGWLVFLFLAVFSVDASAQTLIGTARQNEAGSWRVTPFLRDVRGQRLAFNVPAGAGTSNSVPGTIDGSWGGLKLGWQHGDDVEYFLQAGGGHYALDTASSTLTNHLTGERVGWELAAGLKALIVPETPVTPAMSLAVTAGRSTSEFNALRQSGVRSDAAQRLTVDRMEAALLGSKRFSRVEPYAGMVWSEVRGKLK